MNDAATVHLLRLDGHQHPVVEVHGASSLQVKLRVVGQGPHNLPADRGVAPFGEIAPGVDQRPNAVLRPEEQVAVDRDDRLMVERTEVQQRESLDRVIEILPNVAVHRSVERVGRSRREYQQVAISQRRVQVGAKRQSGDRAIGNGEGAAFIEECVLGESNDAVAPVGRVTVDQVATVVF